MLIDSHIHLTYHSMANLSAKKREENEIPYLAIDEDAKAVRARGTRSEMIDRMKNAGVTAVIEPAISFFGNQTILDFAHANEGFIYTAVGRHPKFCFEKTEINTDGRRAPVRWRDRCSLYEWSQDDTVVAIGETGLDYHYAKTFREKRRQRKWFIYQIKLAHQRRLPLILHIREADDDALRILRRYRRMLHGGVVHCFCGDVKTANEYLKLGLHIGIGGSLMREKIAAAGLRKAVAAIPLGRLIVETDAPFQLPDETYFAEGEKKKKMRNSSLLLPLVIGETASIKGIPRETVEDAAYQNTVRLFRLGDRQ